MLQHDFSELRVSLYQDSDDDERAPMVSSFLSSTLYSPDFVVWIAVVVVAEVKVVDS